MTWHVEGRQDGTAIVRRNGVDLSEQVHAVTIRLEAGKPPTIKLEMITGNIEFDGSADEEPSE